jgi:hypothetical protein
VEASAQADPKTLIFIGGAEGSGTSMLRRLLAAPERCASVGPDFVQLPDRPDALALFSAFVNVTERLWECTSSLDEHLEARYEWREAARELCWSPAFVGRTHLVVKRSFPFGVPHGRCCPDLWNVLDLFADARIVVLYREPCAAVYSTFRRGFDSDLRRLAVSCADHLTRLASQVRAIDPARVRIISYEALCEEPEATLEPLTAFCGIPFEPVLEAVCREQMTIGGDRRFASDLPQPDAAWLERFFDARRRRAWDVLEKDAPALRYGAAKMR